MEIVVAIIAVLCGVIGILGSILPALPGPPLTWAGLLLLYFWGGTNGDGEPMSLTVLLVMLGVTVLVSIIDYVVPMYLTKATGGTKYAERGALVGLILGSFLIPPLGMIIGSFLGAFLMEIYYARKTSGDCCVMMYYIVVYMF